MYTVMELLPAREDGGDWPACHEAGCPHPARYGIAEWSQDRATRVALLVLCQYHFGNWGAQPPPYPKTPRKGVYHA